MSNNATEHAPEKSNFARRCNLLSQYFKQNGSFRGIDLGLTRKPDSHIGFAGKHKPTGQQNSMQMSEASEMKPIDVIQKLCGAVPSSSSAGAKVADLSKPESVPELGTSQLTIFFGGKVIVFNEFPADKAKEIMEIAKVANPETFSNVAYGSESMADDEHLKDNNNNNNIIISSSNNNSNSNIIMTSSSNNGNSNSKGNMVIPDLNEPTSSENSNSQTRQQNQLVERIARRASLHRFFAKRKDRAVARAPYQVNQNAGHPPKPETGSSSLEQGQSSGQANNIVTTVPPKGDKDQSQEEEKEENGECLKDLELRL